MREYTMEIGGIEHNVQLSDEEAERRGLKSEPKAPVTKAAKAPANKAAPAPSDKGA